MTDDLHPPADRPTAPKPGSGEDHVATILRDIQCPACEYNLRGLAGPIVTCPECGAAHDLAKLVAAKWDKPWWRAPGLNALFMPTAVAVMTPIALIPAAAIGSMMRSSMAVSMLTMFFMAVLWVAAMAWAYRRFDRPEAIGLALLAHAVFAGYLVSIIGIVSFCATAAVGLFDTPPRFTVLAIAIPFVAVLAGVFWLCRRGEKFIGHRCIKRHLAKLRGGA